MEKREWLLIGGPAQGQVITADAGIKEFHVPTATGGVYVYHATQYVHDRAVYQLGICRSNGQAPEEDCDVPAMIARTRLKPLAEA